MSLLIGIIDQEISSNQVSWSDSKIGGQPVWITEANSAAISRCSRCALDLTLVVQLYCPLANSAYHRCLYVFVCTTTSCQQFNRWKVYRGMRLDESYNTTTKEKDNNTTKQFNKDMWTDDQDDWGDDDDGEDWGNDENASDDDDDDDDDDDNSTFHQHSSTIDTSSSSLSTCMMNRVQCPSFSSDKRGGGAMKNVCDVVDNSISEAKEVPEEFALSRDETDCDLSSSLSTMTVEGNQTADPKSEGDALMEDLNVPDVHSRLDQLASVLNTKYNKDSTSSHHTSSRQSLVLKGYYLSVVEGTPSKQSHKASADNDRHIASLVQDYEKAEGKRIKDIIRNRDESKGKGGSEMYEKADIKHGDRMFHKFLKELQKYPEQCIRYERCSEPLLVQGLNPIESVIPPCPKCGSTRVFELQLVPALIPWLSSHDEIPSSIEYGTILVYTCSKSCPSSNDGGRGNLDLVEEHVIVQYDPDHHLYR